MSPDWMALERKWRKVVGNESTLGSRSGDWHVKKEYSGDGLAPIAGEPDEVAIYYRPCRNSRQEIARYDLDEVNVDA